MIKMEIPEKYKVYILPGAKGTNSTSFLTRN